MCAQASKSRSVGVLCHNDLSLNIIDSTSMNNYFDTAAEYIVADVSYDSHTVRLYAFYRHPSKSISEFIELFFNYLNYSKPISKTLIAGDFNINLNKYDSNVFVQRYVDGLCDLHFLPLSILPTHYAADTCSTIDHIFMNFGFDDNNYSSVKSLTVTSDLSDHFGNIIILVSKSKRVSYSDRPLTRIFSNSNIINFQSQLSMVDWSFIYNSDSIDDSIAYLSNTLLNLFNLNFPTVQCSRKSLKDKPWLNADLKKRIRIKNKLYYRAKQSNNIDDERAYKEYRNITEKDIEKFRKKYFQDLLDNRYNSIKNIWKTLNNLCSYNNNKRKSGISHLSTAKGEIRNNLDIAEEFNNYFINIGKDLASAFPDGKLDYENYLKGNFLNSMFVTPSNIGEVTSIILSLNKSSSTGPDEISSKLLRLSANIIAGPLVYVINKSFQLGIFPAEFKVAKVISVYKKGNLDKTENNRPISLLSNLSKIFERVIHKRLSCYLSKEKVLYENQFGFRTGHSTMDAIYSCINMLRLTKGNKNYVLGVFSIYLKLLIPWITIFY